MSNQGDTVNSSNGKMKKQQQMRQQSRRRQHRLMQENNTHMSESKEIQLELELFQPNQPSKDGLLNPLKGSMKAPMLESHGETLTLTESESQAQSQGQIHQSELFSHEDLEEYQLQLHIDRAQLNS